MSRFIASTVTSIARPPLLVILISEEQAGWCKQLSEEGYDVIHILFPPNAGSPLVNAVQEANQLAKGRADHYWALITYGADSVLLRTVTGQFDRQNLKACVHFCPAAGDGDGLVANNTDGPIPTIFHLSTNQDALNASLVEMIDSISLQHAVPTSCYPPVVVHTYPKVTADPPFPYSMKAPALVIAGETSSVGPYIRSAVGLSYTRTLELLRRHLGPHFDLEGLWEKHTYFEFVERDAMKTMSTMVSAPYVNHVPTMTGGVGFEDLARFYKYHFTRENVTPPDTELITVSRTVGADRVIDEMIFKCTHTTEIDYFLPGIKATGKPLELALVGVVAFRGDKLTFEHIYWDQASALVQLGLLSSEHLPVAGVEVARKVVDPFGLPSNTLMKKWNESESLSIQ